MTVGSEGRDVFSGSVGGRGSAPPPPVEGSSQPGGVHSTPAPRVGRGAGDGGGVRALGECGV